jgi:signal transduction histidine kinase
MNPTTFFSDAGFMPHGHCYLWTPALLWMYILADTVIGLSYYSIPLALLYFVRRRVDLQFSWILLLFSAFIFACGTTHFISVWTIWHPDYWLDASVKVITAMVSVVTAGILWPLIPKALRLPSTAQLNEALRRSESEVEQRKRAEVALAAMNESLEARVLARTHDLEQAQQKVAEMLASERYAREESERTNLMKDEFLATLSHELRTPLNAMFGWTQVAQQNPANVDLVSKSLAVIDRNIRLQTKLIEDLLDMTAIVSGKIRLDVQPVNLADVIENAIASIKPSADAKSIRIESVIDPLAANVVGDAGRFQQVLWNLLTNAVKFTDKGGKIVTVLERVNSHVELSVTDTGRGIDASFLPYVFDRFSQADASTRRQHGGLGIGLALVKSLIELSGGNVRVTSPGLGQGATFILALPVRATHYEEQSRRHPATPTYQLSPQIDATDLGGVNVLVIDDEEDAGELVRLILEDHGASVTVCTSVMAALEVISKWEPTIVICDIGMPDEDGFDFLRRAKANGLTRPVVALTAFARAEDRIKALRAGFRGHLVKPVEPAELLTFVASVVGRIA